MKSKLLITIGDVNGIGPEIILKSIKLLAGNKKFELSIVSPVEVLEFYTKLFRCENLLEDIFVVNLKVKKLKAQPGKISRLSGYASGAAIKKAVKLCLKKKYDGIVTAPISKEALNLGGFNFGGHTEMLLRYGKAKDNLMLMSGKKMKVAFVTTHPPLKKVASLINRKRILSKLKLSYNSLKLDFNIRNPKIAMLGLNPHAGDGGLIGTEEKKILKPVIETFNKKKKSKVVHGPFSADAYFANQSYRKYDLTLAMYHDQGLIPFKMMERFDGVNFTAGLKFVRTSPDHGTAFDIAGKGIADARSFVNAIHLADKIIRNRRN